MDRNFCLKETILSFPIQSEYLVLVWLDLTLSCKSLFPRVKKEWPSIHSTLWMLWLQPAIACFHLVNWLSFLLNQASFFYVTSLPSMDQTKFDALTMYSG